MLDESDIVEALRACYTSANPYRRAIDIVDLGLIESIELEHDLEAPGANVPGVPSRFCLTLTLIAPAVDDDATAQLKAQIVNRLAGIERISRSTVLFSATLWTPARISAEIRRRLNLDFLILNNP